GVGHVRLVRRRLTMILRGSTPRSLSAAGVLAVLAVGGLLLPLLPTRAQTPTIQRQGEERLAQERQDRDLQKAREELHRAAQDVAAMRDQLDKQRAELERNARRVEEAMNRLRQAQDRLAQKERAAQGGPGGLAPRPGGAGSVPGEAAKGFPGEGGG